jgi:Zn-dependent peptidase ImmA (M78 family)
MTLAHELGHAVMHAGAPKSRKMAVTGTTSFSKTNPLESAEHQAKVFAAAFLIDDQVASGLLSPEDISAEFVVSLQAAEICFNRLRSKAQKAQAKERVRIAKQQFQSMNSKPAHSIRYLNDPCVGCGNATLIQIGTKLLCHTCDYLSDQLPDGD